MEFLIWFGMSFAFYTLLNRLVFERRTSKTWTWNAYQWWWVFYGLLLVFLAFTSPGSAPTLLGIYAAIILSDVVHKKRVDKLNAAKSK